MEDTVRPDGFYWLYPRDGAPFVAKFAEGHWTIIGSIFLLPDADPDMRFYEVGPAINPPKRRLRAVAAAA